MVMTWPRMSSAFIRKRRRPPLVGGGTTAAAPLRVLTAEMDVFLMIRRCKTTIFTDAKESTTVYELKRIVEGILKRPPEDQRLYKNHKWRSGKKDGCRVWFSTRRNRNLQDDVLLSDSQTLGNCGFTNQTARPQAPATVGLAFRLSDDSFEQLRVEAFSTPPELPDVMKPQDSGSTANEQAIQ